ncbi:uncharacterized protein Z520_11104 [Fonsecaea multimorphosa CBS 102226]|uniref:chitinase n=1 Tax=Fonsecaea multimorphosa CBS 102226 TaxID=1442371 RepID=A0A0D2JS36_9EURO|nr:uncharacterized protein Z520_11104 [Fonsecaea multimorphosa CBS 102226]KIX93249.1 hypothetical protein Z520_11104 [Fonsecaea multimorphosa CBS 102226]OAL18479.1 hypothetical protein AYO22_10675 [Fonsecaea multimorphosa]
MAFYDRFVLFLCLTLCTYSVLASTPTGDWKGIAASLRSTLDAIELSHAQHLPRSGGSRSRRDAIFRAGPSGYWRPLAPSQRPNSSEDFSEQLDQLVGEIGSAVEQLIELLASEFNFGTLSTTLPTPPQTTIFPITDINTTPSGSTILTSYATSSPINTAPFTSSIPSPTATSTFNPQAPDLNVVYYSQTDLTPVISLAQICNDPAVDVVILAFVTSLISNGGYPAMNMASNCWAPHAAQQAAGATGLLDCVGDGFSSMIATCQQQGKKVLLSLGGSVGTLTMSSQDQAVEVANTLWSLFLGGSNATLAPLRPYGNIVLDGIDIDNELPSAATYIPTLVSTLRQLMGSDSSKSYYLSAAPQCPRPDASIPVASLLNYIDFFSVQFYNNPSCQLSSGQGFFDSLQAWSADLQALNDTLSSTRRNKRSSRGGAVLRIRQEASPDNTFYNINNGITSPRLLIGTPAFPAAGSGYVDVATYKSILEQVKNMSLPNLAGAMFWDGAYQEVSAQEVPDGDGGSQNVTFAQVVREVLAQ